MRTKNIEVAIWLVGRILPEAKKVTFAHSKLISDISTLTELGDQAAQTIKEGIEGGIVRRDKHADDCLQRA